MMMVPKEFGYLLADEAPALRLVVARVLLRADSHSFPSLNSSLRLGLHCHFAITCSNLMASDQ